MSKSLAIGIMVLYLRRFDIAGLVDSLAIGVIDLAWTFVKFPDVYIVHERCIPWWENSRGEKARSGVSRCHC